MKKIVFNVIILTFLVVSITPLINFDAKESKQVTTNYVSPSHNYEYSTTSYAYISGYYHNQGGGAVDYGHVETWSNLPNVSACIQHSPSSSAKYCSTTSNGYASINSAAQFDDAKIQTTHTY